MAHIHARLGDFDEARRHYRQVIRSLADDGLDGASATSIRSDLNPSEVELMYELATLVRDAGEEDDLLRLFGIVARCTDAVVLRWCWSMYYDQELPEKIHADYATLLRRAGRDAEADVQDAKVEKFRARRVRMSRPR